MTTPPEKETKSPDAAQIFEAPPGPGLADRAPTSEELLDPEETKPPEPVEKREAVVLVEALEGIMEAAGEPPLKTWERAVLAWSFEGLDLAYVDIPQPYRAGGGVALVVGGRVYQKRKTQIESIEDTTP